MIFRACSEYVYNWMIQQEHVKEESLTDWLLYIISQRCEFIYYHTFSRHEESQNGGDWEWWILTSDNSGLHKFNAYRFLVQAKKLLPYEKDNYSLINYGNKYGSQIDLLIDFAKSVHAFPLYMYYSIGKPDILEQVKHNIYIEEDIIRLSQNYNDGCYLSSAFDVYNLLYSRLREKILDNQLLNRSINLSLLDFALESGKDKINGALSMINSEIRKLGYITNKYNKYGISGIWHSEESIPQYLYEFISQNDISFYDEEMKISGLGVIDLR